MEKDRISLLPDELLHHILSFLDTQMIIKTTLLLSKRWTNLWTSIPTLLFHFPSFSCHHFKRERCFRRFIKRVLSHRRMHLTPFSRVNKLSLCFVIDPLGSGPRDEEIRYSKRYEIEDRTLFRVLFYFAVHNHVEELCINGGFVDFSDWCHRFTTCRSLKLSGYFDSIWMPYSFEFLKSLEIENFYAPFCFELDANILPNYPVLERLILRGSCFERLFVSAPKLEYLELGTLSCYDDRFSPLVLLLTPKLASINLDDAVPDLISTDRFVSIQKVEFYLCYKISVDDFDVKLKKEIGEKLRKILNLIQKANSVTLNSFAVKMLSKFIDPSSMKDHVFQNLRHLRLNGGVKKPNHILNCLRNSPFLETWHHEKPLERFS